MKNLKIEITDDFYNKIEELKVKLNSASIACVIEDSIKLTAHLVDKKGKNDEVIVRDKVTNEETVLITVK